MPENNFQHIYVDTDFLKPYLFFGNDLLKRLLGSDKRIERGKKRFLEDKIRDSGRNSEIQIKIPFVVLGEAYKDFSSNCLINDDSVNNHLRDELSRLLSETSVDLVPPKGNCFDIARQIASDEDDRQRIRHTDILIVSQALSDENSSLLMTTDYGILESGSLGVISRINDDLTDNGPRHRRLNFGPNDLL